MQAEPSPDDRVTCRNWIGVVSREHVLIGVRGGFAMLNHGKLAPLKRLSVGDWLAYYSPRTSYPNGAPLKAFTAIGRVKDAEPYQAEMGPGLMGYRRDMHWLDAKEVALDALRDNLEFTRQNWGMLARRGVFEINEPDRKVICAAMIQEGSSCS